MLTVWCVWTTEWVKCTYQFSRQNTKELTFNSAESTQMHHLPFGSYWQLEWSTPTNDQLSWHLHVMATINNPWSEVLGEVTSFDIIFPQPYPFSFLVPVVYTYIFWGACCGSLRDKLLTISTNFDLWRTMISTNFNTQFSNSCLEVLKLSFWANFFFLWFIEIKHFWVLGLGWVY